MLRKLMIHSGSGASRRALGIAVAVAFAYYAGAKLGLALTPAPQPISTLWPPNAILLGAMLLAPVAAWPLIVLAAFPAHLAVELQGGVPLSMILSWFVSNCTEALIGAIGIRAFIERPVRFDSFRRVGIFVGFGAFLAPFLSSFLDAAFVKANGWGESGYWLVWSDRLFSNVLANLILVPAIVAVAEHRRTPLRSVPPRHLTEAMLLGLGLLAVCIVAFVSPLQATHATPALLYAPLPFLLWASVRFGPAGTSVCLLGVALLSVWGAIHGQGPFADRSARENVLSLQFFLIVTYIPLMALAAVLRERASAEAEARHNEEQLRLAEAALRDETALREREIHLRELADAMPQIVWSASPDGVIDYFNGKWYELTQTTPTAVVGDDWLGILHPDDLSGCQATWRSNVSQGRPHEHMTRFLSVLTGAYRWHLIRALPVRNSDGAIARWYGTCTDIDDRIRVEQALRDSEAKLRAFGVELEQRVTERTRELSFANAALRDEIDVRMRAEHALRSSEERFAKAFRAGPDAISITRQSDDSVIEVNERWEAMFGFTHAEAVGRTIEDLGICANVANYKRYRATMASQGFVHELEADVRNKAGEILRTVLVSETVEVGNEPCVITMIRDITARRRTEHEVAAQRSQLAHLGRVAVLGELSGALAHELNQPLTAIVANASAARRLMSRRKFDLNEIRTILADIGTDSLRAGAVIRRMRNLIRKGDIEPQAVMANEIVSEVLGLAHGDLLLREVTVRTQLAPSLPPMLVDRVQIQQVMLNLIVNACDAMADTPRADRTLVIATTGQGSAVCLSVSDRGTGITGDSVDAVFEPFVTTKEHGLGLGLAICRSIVLAHDGRMWATNNDDRGATFYVVLPSARASSSAGSATSNRRAPSTYA